MQKLVWQNANGLEIDLTSGNYGITEWQGFSNTSLNIQQQQVPFQDGGVFLDALMEQRELTVTLAIQDNNNLETRYEKRRELISALNPKLGEGYLIYTNDFISKRIKCVPQIPIFETHNSDTAGTPKASLSWTACEPYWEDLEATEVEISPNADNVIVNNGDVDCGVEIETDITNMENPSIENKSQNKKIELNGLFHKVSINTNSGNKSVSKNIFNLKLVAQSEACNGISYIKESGIMWLGFGSSFDFGISTRYITKNGINPSEYGFVKVIYVDGYYYGIQHVNLRKSKDLVNWTTVQTGSPSKIMNDIIYNGELFVIVAQDGCIKTSSDGNTWETQTSGVSANINSIAYSKDLGVYIAVGYGGLILKSTNGTTWTQVTVDSSREFYCCRYINGMFYILGANNEMWISSTSTDWTKITFTSSGQLRSICYGNGLYVVGTSAGYCYSEDGFLWTRRSVDGVSYYIEYSEKENVFVCANNKGVISKSSNAIDWEIVSNSSNITNIATGSFANGKYIFAGGNIIVSEDSENWTTISPTIIEAVPVEISTINFSEIIFQDNKYYAIIRTTSLEEPRFRCHIAVSEDLHSWTSVLVVNNTTSRGYIVYGNNMFIATISTHIYKSTDGENWTEQSSGYPSITFDGICFDGSQFIMSNGYTMIKSTDGENWISQTNQIMINGITKGGNRYIGTRSSSNLSISYDTNIWSKLSESGVMVFYDSHYKLFFITTVNNAIIKYSTDCIVVESAVACSGETFKAFASNSEGVVLFATAHGVFRLDVSQEENAISQLTTNSDMTLGLKKGENRIFTQCSNGTINTRIKFRQKYIGV